MALTVPSSTQRGVITSYGLDWSPDLIWPDHSRFWGRLGDRVANFSDQEAVYILHHSETGWFYVGITRDGLRQRLRRHWTRDHVGQWNRFSWFGFRAVEDRPAGECQLLDSAWEGEARLLLVKDVITDIEAILTRLPLKAETGFGNDALSKLKYAEQWFQVDSDKARELRHRASRP